QLQNGFGGLGADTEPVLGPLRVDLDQARLFLWVMAADDLDGAAVAAGARVGDGDAVLGIADLAKPGELDLDSHDETISCGCHAAIRLSQADCPDSVLPYVCDRR